MLDATFAATPEKLSASPSGASRHGSHQMASAITCERLYALRYIHGIVESPTTEPPWRLTGTLVHLVLSYHYALQLPNPPAWATERTLDEALAAEGRGRFENIRTAREVYEYYKQHCAAGDTWRPFLVEHELSATIGELDPDGKSANPAVDSTVVTAKCDLIAELNGELWIVDHKCSSGGWGAARSGRLERWKDDGEYLMSWQAMLYLHIVRLRLAPRPVRGFVIQRIKRTAPYDVDRNPLRIPRRAYQQVPRSARQMVEREFVIRENLAKGIAPLANYAACMGRYGPCSYRNLCAADSESEAAAVMASDYVTIGGLSGLEHDDAP
jgi:hypothetical protein